MTTLWRKAIADFWQERTRTTLVVLAIALGIAGFTTVMASYAILTRELNEGFLATNPASATLYTDAVDDALLTAVLQNPKVGAAEPRRVVTGKLKSGPAQWRNLVLFVVKDFNQMRIGTLTHESGAWPPATGAILIERDAFQVAKTRLGERVTVKTANGGEHSLLVSGGVHDVGQAQARMDKVVYGYITVETLAQLGEQPVFDEIKIVVAQDALNQTHIRDVVAQLAKTMEQAGHPMQRSDVPSPGKHPHAQIMGMLLLVMAGFGLLVLLLSGVLVANLLIALMAAQTRQIGVMKAIGGSRWQIARIYLAQSAFLGVVALFIAVPAGIWGAAVLCRYLAVFLNFDIHSLAVPLWVFALVGVVGVIVPLLAAALPILKACRISAHAALSDHGTSSQQYGSSRFDRALVRLHFGGGAFAMALRNAFRRRSRLVLTLITLSVSGVFLMAALNVRGSMIETLDRVFATRPYDLSFELTGLADDSAIDRAVRTTKGIALAEAWIKTDGTLAADENPEQSAATPNRQSGEFQFMTFALPPRTALFKPNIIEGRNLDAGDTDAVVVNHVMAAMNPRIKVGKLIKLNIGNDRFGTQSREWRVVGISREAFSPPIAYIPKTYFIASHPDMSNSINLVLDRPGDAAMNAVKADFDRNLTQQGIHARGAYGKEESREVIDEHIVMIYVFLIIMACLIGGVGGLGLATTVSLNVLERRREMGVLRAIGATPRTVWLIVVGESVMVGLMSCVLAVALAYPASKGIGDLLVGMVLRSVLDFRFDPNGIWIWFALTLVLTIMASFAPAWHASRSSVRDAIACE